ncbi:GAP family protein [Mycobacterium sp. OAE908]|uniref:GAP family protein n=1 Tax=Mycobacterium sp. OAE908 TaxID=2817899 RepID=UPI001AE3311F
MWGTVLIVALVAACDPVRLSIALLLISRPRPMLNLLGYWLGGMVAGITAAVGLLLVLRTVAPVLTQHAAAAAESPIVRHIQIGGGITALAIAAVIAVGLAARQRSRVEVAVGAASSAMGRPDTVTALSRLSNLGRNTLEDRFFWVAFVAGVVSAIPPVEYLVVIAVILSSGAAAGTQVSAALIFTVVSLAVIEIPLVSCLATPVKTHATMLRLHDWTAARRRVILAIGVAMVGTFLVFTGIGNG